MTLRYRSFACAVSITLAIVAMVHAESDDDIWLDDKWQNDIIAWVKASDVKRIDSTLPSQHLEEWLWQEIAASVALHWDVSGCDLKWEDPEPPGGYPLCVEVRAEPGGELDLSLQLQVGTFRSGQLRLREDRAPQLFKTSHVWNGRVGDIPYECSGILERLSDLPKTIARLSMEECQ